MSMEITSAAASLPRQEFVEDALVNIAELAESGVVYNPEYKSLRENLSRAFEKQVDAVLYGERQARKEIRDLLQGLSLRGFNKAEANLDLATSCLDFHLVKTYRARLAKVAAILGENNLPPVPSDFVELIDRWVGYFEAIESLRPLIVKGKRPVKSDTPARTLENTGTCGICGRNVKRGPDGKLHHHGYQVNGGAFVGTCFGTGFQPVEVDSLAMGAYITKLESFYENRLALIARLPVEKWPLPFSRISFGQKLRMVGDGEPEYEALMNSVLDEWKREAKRAKEEAEAFAKAVVEWTEKPLPGVLAGFER